MIQMLAVILAATPAASTYPVAVTLRVDDRVVATKRLTMDEGEPALVDAGDYTLTLDVRREMVEGRPFARIDSKLVQRRGDGQPLLLGSPTMTTRFGIESTYETRGEGSPKVSLSYRVDVPR